LLSLGIDKRRVLELQNAADERYFAFPAQPMLVLEPRPTLLYVGQFIARKGVHLLLRAAATLQKQGCKFSLLLVGSGRDKQAAERLARELGLKNVHFHPSKTPAEMPGVYRSADVLVFPTLEDPWGLVANEAMISGLPVLCSKYAGCAPELFPSDSIFDPDNAEEFVHKLRAAVAGQLPKPDLSRLKSNAQITSELVAALNSSMRKPLQPVEASGQVPA
jgi:glycosyltransferase involved in cell wall biosynthesis